MKNLPLRIELAVEGSWHRILQKLIGNTRKTRKYHTIKVEDSDTWNSKTLQVFYRHLGSDLRVFETEGCSFENHDAKVVNKLFASMKKLEVLRCTDADFPELYTMKDSDHSAFKPHNLPHLKTVVLQNSHFGVSCNLCLLETILTLAFRFLSLSEHRSLQP